jgi:hypothetical protein
VSQSKLASRLAPLALIGLLALFMAKLIFTNLILARGDTYLYFYPYWDVAIDAIQAGRLPLWNDLIFMGAPFMANSQVGLFYLPNWPIWLLTDHAALAIKWSILLHLVWAGLGTYLLLRGPLQLTTVPALIGAAFFMVGGHLTAHIEQINQLQGLAWLPWLFLLLTLARRRPRQYGPLLAASLALQLLSGHTQTVFIGLIGMGCMALWWAWREDADHSPRQRILPLLVLILAGGMALALALPQLLPTMSMSSISNRSGGLSFNEVISFSLHPAVIGRAFLPGYDVALHTEYIATIGIAGLALALIGAWLSWQRGVQWQGWVLITLIGLLLAPGGWNPVYWLLGRLPGFNLFRVPARWLALWALGSSVLAAYAVQHLHHQISPRSRRWILIVIAVATLGLIGGSFLSSLSGEIYLSGMVRPSLMALAGWVITLLLVLALVGWHRRWTGLALAGIALLELLIASGHMPYTHLTAPDALVEPRPTINRMLAEYDDQNTIPPGRTLAISNIFFGPSDQPVIRAAFEDQLPEYAIYDLLIASKLKDVVAPNLNMIWDVPSADGFDGGILPSRYYTAFSALLLDEPQPDGRLRETLTTIPDQRWLDLMGVTYLLTDRVNDRWYDDIYFDLSWQTPLNIGDQITLTALPDFTATALVLVIETPETTPSPLITINMTADGDAVETPGSDLEALPESSDALIRFSWETPTIPESITLSNLADPVVIRGAALVNEESGDFHIITVTPGGSWKLLQAGDVKIYQNAASPARAWLVYRAETNISDETAFAQMQDAAFAPSQTVLLANEAPALTGNADSGTVTLTAYAPEHIALEVTTAHPAYLVLSEAYGPGWQATINSESTPIYRADILFRAIYIPAGTHTVNLSYTPTSWPLSLVVGALAWFSLIVGTAFAFYRGSGLSTGPSRS